MYTIKHAAELTGVPVATLRAWERRYGVVAPRRTSGGYRLYDDAALGRVRAMRALVDAGWAPRQAAEEVARAEERSAAPVGAAVETRSARGLGSAAPGPPSAGTGEGRAPEPGTAPPAAPAPEDLDGVADLVAAASALDGPAVAAVLDEHLARGSFERVVDGWLMPALHAVGEAWARREVSTAGEHLVAHAVLRRLAAAFEAAAHTDRGPRVVVGLPAGVRHELGALAFAVAARRAGLAVTYVGPDLPAEGWLDAIARTAPDAVVLAVPRRRDVPAAAAVVGAIRAAHPDLRVFVGGGAQDAEAVPAPALGHGIAEAADRLAHALVGR